MKQIKPLILFPVLGILTACQSVEAPAGSDLRTAPPQATDSANQTAETPRAKALEKTETPAPERRTEIIQGTGEFINPNATGNGSSAAVRSDDGISLNLVDASIEQAANTVLGEILGRSFIVQEGVTGSITLQTSSPIAADALLPILEDVLKAQNLALVQRGDVFEILPAASASRYGPTVVLQNGERAERSGYKTVIRSLEFVPADDVAEILTEVSPQGGVLRTDTTRNLLVLAGTKREIDAMLETIDIFDVDWLAGMSFAIVPVSSAQPGEIVREIEAIASDGTNDSPFLSLVRMLPNERMGSIIVISPQSSYLQQAQTWIRRLDKQTSSAAEQLFLYNVQNSVAEDLALILENIIFSGTGRSGGLGGVAPGLDTVRVQRQGADGNDATPTQPSARRGAASITSSGISGLEGVRIFPYEGRNALAIVGTADQYRRVETMLKTLDVGANQVLLEATIVEVTLRDELSRGVRWFFGDEQNEVSFSDVATGAIAPSFPGFAYTFDNDDVRVAIDALSSLTDVNFLSSPSIMVLDNTTATLQVGDEVPIATQSAVGVIDAGAPIVNSVSFRDTGVILTITPRVNDSGVVLLEIEQEVSDVVPTITSGIDSPTIQQRRIQTTVAVQDGSSLALGGLIEDSVSTTTVAVPFISRVPVLGELFKSQSDITDRTELLIIITPHVIRNAQEAQDVTNELRQRLRGIAPFAERLRLDPLADE